MNEFDFFQKIQDLGFKVAKGEITPLNAAIEAHGCILLATFELDEEIVLQHLVDAAAAADKFHEMFPNVDYDLSEAYTRVQLQFFDRFF